ncbi:hypothetical protein KGF56_000118 [Candida oxycetoniae]|uniref:Uncharacterized protein n=1 Tax=Candida oxycetoniae TaxID=497107 RepID=A0AAI9X0G7_9ASCO|nr:uncharacterized protein KGF56_000118 [Candida oxycetoniae]KAI3407030.2 hypothetical protein KGF56_000118 [Candida oxycetoniae]
MTTVCTSTDVASVTLDNCLDILVDLGWERSVGSIEKIYVSRISLIIETIQSILKVGQIFSNDELRFVEAYIKERPTRQLTKQDLKAFISRSLYENSIGKVLSENFGFTNERLRDCIKNRGSNYKPQGSDVDVDVDVGELWKNDNYRAYKAEQIEEKLRARKMVNGISKGEANGRASRHSESAKEKDTKEKLEQYCRDCKNTCELLRTQISNLSTTLRTLETTIAEQDRLIQTLRIKESSSTHLLLDFVRKICAYFMELCSKFSTTRVSPPSIALCNKTRLKIPSGKDHQHMQYILLASISICAFIVLLILASFFLNGYRNSSSMGYIYDTHDRPSSLPLLDFCSRRFPMLEERLYRYFEW